MRDEQKNRKQPRGHQAHEAPGRSAQRPVYYISIVAEMVETHPQTLRMYERMGLIAPRRTRNNIRLYSDDDVATVRRIQHLTQQLGVNLAGVEVVFKLLDEMERMRAHLEAQIGIEWQEILREASANETEPGSDSDSSAARHQQAGAPNGSFPSDRRGQA
jgi:MerR family transcriptional regulator/heat shock protein HspR